MTRKLRSKEDRIGIELFWNIANCWLQMGDLEKAADEAQFGVSTQRHYAGFHHLAAQAELQRGRPQRALIAIANGYLYGVMDNTFGSRASNLQLWDEIRRDILEQQSSRKASSKAK